MDSSISQLMQFFTCGRLSQIVDTGPLRSYCTESASCGPDLSCWTTLAIAFDSHLWIDGLSTVQSVNYRIMGPERNVDVFEAIRTTRAMRRLDPRRDVPDDDLRLILDAARRAPSGGNAQPVRWVVVRDPEQRRRVGDIYRRVARPSLVRTYEKRAQSDPAVARLLASSLHLCDHMAEAPVLLIPCAPRGLTRAEG